MSTWQEQVRAWHDASLRMIEKLEALNDVIQLDPESSIFKCTFDLIDGWADSIHAAHPHIGGDEWLAYWAWECKFGHVPALTDDERVTLSDGSKWPLDSIDNLIEMLERQQQIDAEGNA